MASPGGCQLEPGLRVCRRVPPTVRQPEPVGLVQAWPMRHPELAVLLWSGLVLAVFAPLAVRLYTTKSR